MRKINPEHLTALMKMVNDGAYYRLLSMEVVDIGMGYSRVEVDLREKHTNPFGSIHGGVYSSIIDTSAYWSAYCELEESAGLTTIDIDVNILSMISSGFVIVEGRSIKVGRSVCLTEASAKDESGKLLAYGTSKLMVLQGKQSINDAMKTMGCEALPPKFLDI